MITRILILVLCIATPGHAAILVQSVGGTYTTKATLSAAATDPDTAGKSVLVTTALSAVQSNISSATLHAWPADRKLHTSAGGSINPTTTFKFAQGYSGLITPRMFGAVGNGVTNDTVPFQRAINAAAPNNQQVTIPVGTYVITNTLTIYNGTNIKGESGFAFFNSYGPPESSQISFEPTTLKKLFTIAQNTNTGGGTPDFWTKIAINGLIIHGNGAVNSQYALDLDKVIYSSFSDLTIDGFQYPIRAYHTIGNKLTNLFLSGTSAAILYAGGSATTDTWDNCTIGYSPIGVQTTGATIGVRFRNCIFEQLDTYGVNLVKETETMSFIDCYAEDVPYTNVATGAMFRVGFDGTTLSSENHLTVTGGKYAGRNAGVVGSFLDTDYSDSVIVGGFNVSRYTNVIKASSNTRVNSIILTGYEGITWTNNITDVTKVNGLYPSGVINSGSNRLILRVGDVATTAGITAADAVQGALLISTGTVRISGIQVFADNAAAIAGGLVSGDVYKINATANLTTVP